MTVLAALLSLAALQAPAGLQFPDSEPSAPSGDELVRVTLLADRDVVRPGETFALGVRLAIEPGWHVYWTNPGDSGLGTKAAVTAPRGVTLAPVAFPGPHRLELPGDIVNYVYEDETLLWFEATASTELEPGTALRFEASCDWLVCNEICLPGSGTSALSLPVVAEATRAGAGDEPKAANAELFAAYRARLPLPLERLDGARLAWSGTEQRPELTLRVGGARELEFFPLDTPGFRLTGSLEAAAAGERTLELTYRARKNPPEAALTAAGVVRVAGPAPENVRYYRIDHAWDAPSRVPESGSR